MNPREAAVKALYKIEAEGKYFTEAVLEAQSGFETKDRAFINELVTGVFRNKLYIDFIIESYSKIKLKKLSIWILQILRIGVYQLVFMEKVPSSAACNESVKLAARYGHAASKGYVNGVLRTVSRHTEALPVPSGSVLTRYSILYSCQIWLCERFISQFGEERAELILKDSLKPHRTSVRVNTLKTTAEDLVKELSDEGIKGSIDKDEKDCIWIDGAINIKKSKAYSDGKYTLQNINSMRAVKELSPKPDETVIDMCAAPGGKTTYMAEMMKNTGKISAFDIHPHKIELINNAAKRLGIDIIDASVGNSEKPVPELKGCADRVLADVPCSGTGVIHKKPDIKYNRTKEDIDELLKIQRNILNTAAEYVKKGGDIVYSTCSILKEENTEIVDGFLAENKGFKKESERLYLAHETGGSGFYICRLRKI